jgi:hypothetical protein
VIAAVIFYPDKTLTGGAFAESENSLLTFLTLVLVLLLLICYLCTRVIVSRFRTLIEKRSKILKGKPDRRRRFRIRVPGKIVFIYIFNICKLSITNIAGLLYDKKGDTTKVKFIGISYLKRSVR